MADIPSRTAPAGGSAPAPARLLMAVAALAGLIGAGLPGRAAAAGVTGAGQNLQVIDGDTLQSGADIIQLYGVDAPELGQICVRNDQPWQCGVEAAFALQKLVSLSGAPVVCQDWSQAAPNPLPNGEVTRVCLVGSDQDLAQAMLRTGYGVALPGSFPYYGQIERQARQAGLGIWGSQFTLPWEWRDGKRLQIEGAGTDEDCNVEGRVGDAGERSYVVPTDADYQDPKIEAADRFCSDEAARQAGWRRTGEADGKAIGDPETQGTR